MRERISEQPESSCCKNAKENDVEDKKLLIDPVETHCSVAEDEVDDKQKEGRPDWDQDVVACAKLCRRGKRSIGLCPDASELIEYLLTPRPEHLYQVVQLKAKTTVSEELIRRPKLDELHPSIVREKRKPYNVKGLSSQSPVSLPDVFDFVLDMSCYSWICVNG